MAVIGTPLVLWAVCFGCGLACERVLRVRLSNALVLPLGLCVAFVLIYPGYAAGAGDALAIALLLAVAIAGLLLANDGVRSRLNPGWPGIAGLAVYVLYMLPVIAYGHWTWSGYDFVNDSSFEMLLAGHIQGYGMLLGHIPETSEREFLVSYLNSSYPLGTQALLGTLGGMTNTDVAVLYQGFISSLAAFGAIALATLGRGFLSARRAALAGAVALAANLTYQYALQGNIKEIGLLATVCAALALGREAIVLERPYAGSALVAIASAAALCTYNAVAAPFIGALVLFIGLGIALAKRRMPRVGWARPLVAGSALAALLAVPPLLTFSSFFAVARHGQGSTGLGAIQFGQLLRRLPLSQVSGVWLSGEYRLAIVSQHRGLLTAIATAVLAAAIVVALVLALRRRQPGVPAAFATAALVLIVVLPRISPYAQGKLLAMCSPLVVLAGVAGLLCLRGRRAGAFGLALAGFVSLAIVASDMLAYAHDRVAPTARIEAIRQTGDRFAGRGLVLWNEFEEYAKYFARAAKISVPFEAITPQQVQLRLPTYFYGRYFDLDEEMFSFVEKYPLIVTRRSPIASRPPANYKLVYENAYYEGWERMPRLRVLEHLPLQQPYWPTQQVSCQALAPLVAKAPKGAKLVVALAPPERVLEAASDGDRSAAWTPDPSRPGSVFTPNGGYLQGTLAVAHAGRYALWVEGDFPRTVPVHLDGRAIGSLSDSNTPGQWLQAASIWLGAGRHRVRIERTAGHRHFGPGEWATGELGGLALRSETPELLRSVALSRWRTLCGTSADWVEVVEP